MTESVLTDYVSLIPDGDTQARWNDWLLKNKITKQPHQGTHITIIYSETRCDLTALFGCPSVEEIFDTRLKLPTAVVISPDQILGWEAFGKEGQYLVLLVKHHALSRMNRYCLTMGGTMSFPEYRPHITVDEACEGLDKANLPLPDFDLVFDVLQVTREYMVSDM